MKLQTGSKNKLVTPKRATNGKKNEAKKTGVIEGLEILNHQYMPIKGNSFEDWKKDKYYVYILAYDNEAIVVGHGKKNRASVILDSTTHVTKGHIKSIFVRLYNNFKDPKKMQKFLIECLNKDNAKEIEGKLHGLVGGNKKDDLISVFENRLFEDNNYRLGQDANPKKVADIILKMALYSSYSGIDDLCKWKKEGLFTNEVWKNISEKLGLSI